MLIQIENLEKLELSVQNRIYTDKYDNVLYSMDKHIYSPELNCRYFRSRSVITTEVKENQKYKSKKYELKFTPRNPFKIWMVSECLRTNDNDENFLIYVYPDGTLYRIPKQELTEETLTIQLDAKLKKILELHNTIVAGNCIRSQHLEIGKKDCIYMSDSEYIFPCTIYAGNIICNNCADYLPVK